LAERGPLDALGLPLVGRRFETESANLALIQLALLARVGIVDLDVPATIAFSDHYPVLSCSCHRSASEIRNLRAPPNRREGIPAAAQRRMVRGVTLKYLASARSSTHGSCSGNEPTVARR
jgi:hypothetical protein